MARLHPNQSTTKNLHSILIMNKQVEDHWKQASKGLNERAYRSPTAMNAVRLQIAKDILKSYPKGRLLDAGCGGGATSTAMMDDGWDVTPIDFSADMVRETNARLSERGIIDREAFQAPVTDLSKFEDGSFDAIICLGVMYYVEEDEKAYQEFRRVLKPGGVLLCSMQNEFFDLFTLNRYTRRFFKRHFFPLLDGGDKEKVEHLDQALSSLLVNPEEPKSHDPGSSRDAVFMRQDNPIAYPEKVSSFGFEKISGPYYHGIHLVPPILERSNSEWEQESAEKQYGLAEDWRGMFNAAHFLYEFRKDA